VTTTLKSNNKIIRNNNKDNINREQRQETRLISKFHKKYKYECEHNASTMRDIVGQDMGKLRDISSSRNAREMRGKCEIKVRSMLLGSATQLRTKMREQIARLECETRMRNIMRNNK
jgi:hypothetical protein